MAQDCSLQMPEDFVLPLLPAEELKDKYRRYLFRDYVEVCVCVCVLNLFAQMLYQGLHGMANETSEAFGKGVRRKESSVSPCVFASHRIKSDSFPRLFYHSIHCLPRRLGFHLNIFMQIMISQTRPSCFLKGSFTQVTKRNIFSFIQPGFEMTVSEISASS